MNSQVGMPMVQIFSSDVIVFMSKCDAKPPTAKGVDHRRIVNWTSRSVTCHETGR